jgi:hypothetical protein
VAKGLPQELEAGIHNLVEPRQLGVGANGTFIWMGAFVQSKLGDSANTGSAHTTAKISVTAWKYDNLRKSVDASISCLSLTWLKGMQPPEAPFWIYGLRRRDSPFLRGAQRASDLGDHRLSVP